MGVYKKNTSTGPRYYIRYTENGKRKHHRGGFRRWKDADRKWREIQRFLETGTVDRDQMTLNQLYDEWIEEKSNKLRPSTIKSYKQVWRNYIVDSIGRQSLARINKTAIQEWIDTLSEKKKRNGEPLSPYTVRKGYTTLRACIRFGVGKDYLLRDPCQTSMDFPRKRRSKSHQLSPQDASLVVDAVRDAGVRNFFAVLARSGLRKSEGLGLRWKNVDMENRTVEVEEVFTEENGFYDPKTETSYRTVPFLRSLLPYLKNHTAIKEDVSPEALLFSDDGEVPYTNAKLRYYWEEALEKVGVEHATIHSLRGTFASTLNVVGGGPKEAQEQLGHSSPDVTMRAYIRANNEHQNELIRRMDDEYYGNK